MGVGGYRARGDRPETGEDNAAGRMRIKRNQKQKVREAEEKKKQAEKTENHIG